MPTMLRCAFIAGIALLARPCAGGLQAEIDLIIRTAQLKEATIAVCVADPDSQSRLAEFNHEEPMIPASNMKLLTTGAAIHALGPDFAFRTRLIRDERNRLIVIGDGDPAFGDPVLLEDTSLAGVEGLDIETFLAFWVDAASKLDLGVVPELIIDDRIFDRDYFHDAWPTDQLNQAYCAEVAGLNIHQNTIHFYPKPIPGEAPSVARFEPSAQWLRVQNQATSNTAAKQANTFWVARPPDANRFTLRGNVRFAYRRPVRVTVHDPPVFFAELFSDRLKRGNVDVRGHRLALEHEEPFTGTPVGPEISTPLATIVTRCNTASQNMYAEALLKRIAAARTRQPGSWMNGTAILRHILAERGIDVATLVADDGSGLSRRNRITADLMVKWLNTFHDDPVNGGMFVASLAEAKVSGTMRKRMKNVDLHGTRVQAKTGYINRVSCLSGYVTAPDGRRRTFSILVNDLGSPVSEAKALQDRIVGAIAEDLVRVPARLGSD